MKAMKVSGVEVVKLDSLRFNPHVAERSFTEKEYLEQKEKMRNSGITSPFVVERVTQKVLSGNLLLLIAFEMGLTHVPVVYTDFKPQTNRILRSVA